MSYTRKQLEQLSSEFKAKPVLNELLQKVTDNKLISLAEEDYVCAMMRIIRQGPGAGVPVYDVATIPACDNYRFRRTYLLYAHDLDAKGNIYDYYGRVSDTTRTNDVAYLNDAADAWRKKMTGQKTDEALWNYMIDETQHQINLLAKFVKLTTPSKGEIAYQTKSIYLHSRYVYLQVLEFYQDQGYTERLVPMYDQEVLVDPFCFIHTLFRHFAADVKSYQIGKSYHIDRTVLYKELPNFLARFVRIYANNIPRQQFNFRSLDFIYRRRKYTIWFRPFPFKGKKPLRVQTFFPLESKDQLIRIQKRKKIKINSKLTFLVPA
jgi:hypothetical protein